MIIGTKVASGQARCIFTDKIIPKDQVSVEIRISQVQVRQASLEGLRLALNLLESVPSGVQG